ncbi:type VI secretion system baseplate subunit TssF [Bartonella sp. LJL80]
MEKLYQNELGYLRESAQNFTNLNPKLEKFFGKTSTDPDVERLIETFAFLTTRVRSEIDDEMNDFTTSVLSVVCPNLIRPFPSTTLVKFNPIEKAITERQTIKAKSVIKSKDIDRLESLYVMAYDADIYPLEIKGVNLYRTRDNASLSIKFESLTGQPLSEMNMQDLRLTLTGDKQSKTELFLWIGEFIDKAYIQFSDGSKKQLNVISQITPIGYSDEEALQPQTKDNFIAHRILHEYFVFPDKFLGYDIKNLASYFNNNQNATFELIFEFSRPFPTDIAVGDVDFSLYVVPAVNLYKHSSTMIEVHDDKAYYELVPYGQLVNDISIYDITCLKNARQNDLNTNILNKVEYKPFTALSQDTDDPRISEDVFYKVKVEDQLDYKNKKISLYFCKRNGQPAIPNNRSLIAELLCFDEKRTSKLNIGDICKSTDTMPAFVTYANITKPTATVYPPQDSHFNWNLISGLSPNYHDLYNTEAIKNLIRKYNYVIAHNRQEEREFDKRLNGIVDVKTHPVDRLFQGRPVRGIRTTLWINDDAFPSLGEIYFFGSILSHFFRFYATTNAFHQLEFKLTRSGEIFEWPVRYGTQPLI